MSGRPESDLDQALDHVRKAGLVQTVDGEAYTFDHALTQQALYQELSPRRRRKLHLAAGEALERLPERKQRTRTGELAWHFLQGDDPARAQRFSLRAGDE